MAKVIGIAGESGSGKTTAMRTLDPKITFYIDADKKGLSWKKWREQYCAKNKNYISTDDPQRVLELLYKVNMDEIKLKDLCKKNQREYSPMTNENKKQMKMFKVVVIDTLNGIMVGQEMRNIHVNGFGKWSDLAEYVWDIVDYSLTMRQDLTVIILCHAETISDENGVVFTHIKTNGRKLERLVLESKMTTVLYAKNTDDGYKFFTSLKNSTCKTPLGSFKDSTIPNDISLVLKALEDY